MSTPQMRKAPLAGGAVAEQNTISGIFANNQPQHKRLLNESNVPPEPLTSDRDWFQRQMEACAERHGNEWPEYREWLADYRHKKLREQPKKKGARHAL